MRRSNSPGGSATPSEAVQPTDEAMMAQFVRDYLALLGQRLTTIVAQVTAQRAAEADVSLLSLQSTSAMAGADGLAGAARQLRQALLRDDRAALPALVDTLTEEAERVRVLLSRTP